MPIPRLYPLAIFLLVLYSVVTSTPAGAIEVHAQAGTGTLSTELLTSAIPWVPEPTSVRVHDLRLGALVSGVRLVSFEVAWDESWRGPSRPSWVAANDNWDAAWVFLKYRVPGGVWQHATLAADGHMAPAGASVDVPADRLGAFVYRSSEGYGTFTASGVGLAWDVTADQVPKDAQVEVVPFAIAMVFVPRGSFAVGSGGDSPGEFRAGGTGNTPFLVTSPSPLALGDDLGQLMWTTSDLTGSPSGHTQVSFPSGFEPFYAMKHQLTQGEYVNFLNTLTAPQGDARANITTGYRYAITRHRLDSFTTTTPWLAMNAISWADGVAFADWAGLRPLTELEFEKLARGPLSPVKDEFAWGDASIIQTTAIANAGTSVEAWLPTAANAVYGDTAGVQGPVRIDAFATPGRSRQLAGAGYYGALGLSGNLWKRPITVGNAAGRAFDGAHGDGALSADGMADVSSWPGPAGTGAGFRGGSWNYGDDRLRVSDRSSAAHANPVRGNSIGWRGARSAP